MLRAELKGNQLVLTIDIDKKGRDSGSGKTTLHASFGNTELDSVQINGKPVHVGLNVYTRK